MASPSPAPPVRRAGGVQTHEALEDPLAVRRTPGPSSDTVRTTSSPVASVTLTGDAAWRRALSRRLWTTRRRSSRRPLTAAADTRVVSIARGRGTGAVTSSITIASRSTGWAGGRPPRRTGPGRAGRGRGAPSVRVGQQPRRRSLPSRPVRVRELDLELCADAASGLRSSWDASATNRAASWRPRGGRASRSSSRPTSRSRRRSAGRARAGRARRWRSPRPPPRIARPGGARARRHQVVKPTSRANRTGSPTARAARSLGRIVDRLEAGGDIHDQPLTRRCRRGRHDPEGRAVAVGTHVVRVADRRAPSGRRRDRRPTGRRCRSRRPFGPRRRRPGRVVVAAVVTVDGRPRRRRRRRESSARDRPPRRRAGQRASAASTSSDTPPTASATADDDGERVIRRTTERHSERAARADVSPVRRRGGSRRRARSRLGSRRRARRCLLAQLAHVDLDDVGVALEGEVPDVVEDRRPWTRPRPHGASGTPAAANWRGGQLDLGVAAPAPGARPGRAAGRRRSAPPGARPPRRSSARSRASSTTNENGLVRKSSAPVSSASASSCSPSLAVSIRIGVQSPASRSSARRARSRCVPGQHDVEHDRVVGVLGAPATGRRCRRARRRPRSPPPRGPARTARRELLVVLDDQDAHAATVAPPG